MSIIVNLSGNSFWFVIIKINVYTYICIQDSVWSFGIVTLNKNQLGLRLFTDLIMENIANNYYGNVHTRLQNKIFLFADAVVEASLYHKKYHDSAFVWVWDTTIKSRRWFSSQKMLAICI